MIAEDGPLTASEVHARVEGPQPRDRTEWGWNWTAATWSWRSAAA